MTKQRQNFIKCGKCGEVINPSSQFSQWIRNQESLDSNKGYRLSDIDGLWIFESGKYFNETQNYMILESKTNSINKFYWSDKNLSWQIRSLVRLDKHINDEKYYGLHLIQFENESPINGKIFIDEKLITYEDFIKFLQFKLPKEFYKSYYPHH